MGFEKEKLEFLRKRDKSKKGSIDSKIKNLVDKINSLRDFYTTSSCSGRIIMIKEHISRRKDKAKWVFSSHDKVSLKNFETKKMLDKLPKGEIWFKVEPAILHIACNSQEKAVKLLNIARNTGFRRCGIISIGKNKLVLELISTEKIDAIVSKKGKLLIGEDYLTILVREGNKKLENTWKKIENLVNNINMLQ